MEYLDSPEDLALSNLRLYEKLVRPYRRYMDEKVKVHVLTAGVFVSAFNPTRTFGTHRALLFEQSNINNHKAKK